MTKTQLQQEWQQQQKEVNRRLFYQQLQQLQKEFQTNLPWEFWQRVFPAQMQPEQLEWKVVDPQNLSQGWRVTMQGLIQSQNWQAGLEIFQQFQQQLEPLIANQTLKKVVYSPLDIQEGQLQWQLSFECQTWPQKF